MSAKGRRRSIHSVRVGRGHVVPSSWPLLDKGRSWGSVRVSLTPKVTICDPTVRIFGRDFARMNELRVISGYRHGNRYSVLQVYNNRILYIRPAMVLELFSQWEILNKYEQLYQVENH